jgi:zinc transporter 2
MTYPSTAHHSHVKSDRANSPCSKIQSINVSTKTDDTISRLTAASILCFIFLIVEVVGGLLSSSLAVLSDAAHLFADFASFIVAIVASRLAKIPPNASNTFGFHRAEVLAALYSMSCLWAVSLLLGAEAIHRGYMMLTGEISASVDGKIMSLTAAIGVVVNVSLAFILGGEHHHHHGDDHGHDHSHSHSHDHQSQLSSHHDHSHAHSHEAHDHTHQHEESKLLKDEENPDSGASVHATEEENLNLKAAYLHVLADLLQSFCVLLAGLMIWYNPNWHIIDPIATILFCIIVMKTTAGVIFSSISILMNDVPGKIDWEQVYDSIESVGGVFNVHDLHIWSITHGSISLSVHADVDTSHDTETALVAIQNVCKSFGIKHVTIQLQPKKKL